MNEIVNFLKQTDVFYQLTTAQLEMVAHLCQEKSYRLGEIVVEESSNSNELYVITKGEVNILINPGLVGGPQASQDMVVIATLRRGQSFGEIALVDEGLRSATVRSTQKETVLLVIPRDKLLMLCETYPQLGYRLMFNIAADLAMKIRNTDLRIRGTLLYAQK